MLIILLKNKWEILIIALISVFAWTSALSANQNNISNAHYLKYSHQWIKDNRIRSGYLYFNDSISKIKLVKKLGLNTIIVGCYRFEYTKYRQEAIDKMEEWARAAKKNQVHLFFAINWQPYPQTEGHNYNVVVFEDGYKGIAICPLDESFWNERIKYMFTLITNMSTKPDLQVDGIFLDMEIYGSEKEAQIKRDYFEQKCDFSDICFLKYLKYKGYHIGALPPVEMKHRKQWLIKNQLLDDYFAFLKNIIRNQAEQLKNTVHQINPNLLIGMYPHPSKDNFVQYPLAQGFSSERLPLVVFGIHSYGYKVDKNGDGYVFIPEDVQDRYRKDGINVLYLAGYLLRKYDAMTLERNLKQSIKAWEGYWLFTLQLLWKNDKNFKLVDSAKNLEEAIARSNKEQ